jgi:hypothetical protein
MAAVVGRFVPTVKDMSAIVAWFETSHYAAPTAGDSLPAPTSRGGWPATT